MIYIWSVFGGSGNYKFKMLSTKKNKLVFKLPQLTNEQRMLDFVTCNKLTLDIYFIYPLFSPIVLIVLGR